MAAAYILITKK